MSQFRVGQRVRIVWQHEHSAQRLGSVVGLEATITLIGGCDNPRDECRLSVDGDCRTWTAPFSALAPLTDPSADAFMERLKKLGREPVNSPEKVTT